MLRGELQLAHRVAVPGETARRERLYGFDEILEDLGRVVALRIEHDAHEGGRLQARFSAVPRTDLKRGLR